MKRKKTTFSIIMIFTLFMGMNQNIFSQVVEQDSLALVVFYNSTGGDKWTNSTNWLSNKPVSEWFGVRVDSGRVIFLELMSNNLKGEIPPEIGNLAKLDTLHLIENSLTGEIPKEIGNLTNLRFLRLRTNQLTGPLPLEIGNLKNLETLSISSNYVNGDFPVQVLNLTKLTHLWFQWNQFTGAIPPEIGTLKNLEALSLHSNNFTGHYPKEIGHLTKLRFLYLGNRPQGYPANNKITGSIPPEYGNLVNLERLWIINEEKLTGPIPAGFGNFSNIWELDLSGNQLTGAIPQDFINLTNLQYLRINDNQLTDLPDLSLIGSLYLSVENNKFTFEDIEPNIGFLYFSYRLQDSVGIAQDTIISKGSTLTLSVSVGGTANRYQWTKNGAGITGATNDSLIITFNSVSDAGKYICRIKNTIVSDLALYSRAITVSIADVAVDDHNAIQPEKIILYQNHPNPFNGTTQISYSLSKSTLASLTIYNTLGREIQTLVNELQSAGKYSVNFNATDLPNGIYIAKLQAGNKIKTKKILLMK